MKSMLGTKRPSARNLPAPSALPLASCSSSHPELRRRAFTVLPRSRPHVPRLAAASGSGPDGEEDDVQELKIKFFRQQQQPSQPPAQQGGPTLPSELLNAVYPYALGRQARRAFDDLWENLSRISGPARSYSVNDVLEPGFGMDTIDGANRTVLVVGATGRVGRILIRKLLLRGYKVRAMVRPKDGAGADRGLSGAVDIVTGDVGEIVDCKRAVAGVDKIVFCAGARTAFTADLVRVEERGVRNMVGALQDEFRRRDLRAGRNKPSKAKLEIADFGAKYHQEKWDLEFCGLPEGDKVMAGRDLGRSGANTARVEITEQGNLFFGGNLPSRGAYAEVGADITSRLPKGDSRTAGTEGLSLRLRGDGHSYTCILRCAGGHRYAARFPTRNGYMTVRLPFATFRPEGPNQPALSPENVEHMTIRYDHRRAAAAAPAAPAAAIQPGTPMTPATAAAAVTAGSANLNAQRFDMEIDWIKALPSGAEPDFVLVSCAGSGRTDLPEADLQKLLGYKRKGEEALRASGLGYTIVRPGALVEEPGGYKALVFDQGARITESISYADVADICLRALGEGEARNKTFDVCAELQGGDGLGDYELVANVRGGDNNYLAPALATLQKNT